MVIDNKRKSPRFSCLVPIEAKQGDLFDECNTFDFSKGGIGLICNHEMPVGHEIAVELDLDEHGDPVIVLCKVKWIKAMEKNRFRLGLSFSDVLQGSKTRLTKYFNHLT